MDTTIDRISRDVEIEFLVDENGKPYNYRITRSVDAPTDRKALEILKNGPAWIASPQNKKGRVTIQF
jgi:TonB family protein